MAASGSELNVAATGLSAKIAAGSAALQLTGAAGSMGVTNAGATGSASGQAEPVGVPGLTI